MRTLLALCLGLIVAGRAAAQPANDACAAATTIGSLPFAATLDTTTATVDPGDPVPSCTFGSDNTVWFAYTASGDTTLLVDTNGSDYETGIIVYTGGCATPAEVACAADDDVDGTTELLMPVAAGQTVHVFVTGANGAGGNLVLHVARASVDARPPVSVRALVSAGDATPIGGGFARFGRPIALSRTDVAFTGVTEGVFVNDGVATTAIAISGDPSPVGGTFTDLAQPATGASGAVAFVATIAGGTAREGLFLYSGGTTTALVVQGDAAPGGGSFVNFAPGVAISPNGSLVAFVADTTLSTAESIWLATVGGGIQGPLLTELVDTSPCGDTVRLFGSANSSMAIDDFGEIALWERGLQFDAVLRYVGFWLAVACEGSPTPIGGTFRAISRNVRLNGMGGQIIFHSTVTLPGPDTEAIFLDTFGLSVVAQRGDLTTGGETITDFPSNAVADVSDAGVAAFFARTSVGNAILTKPPAAPPTIALAVSQPCPVGGTFRLLDSWVDTDGAGTVGFRAVCEGERGIFTIPAGGGAPVPVALLGDATPAGPGFAYDDPSIQGTAVAFEGTRTGVYRIHCTTSGCDPVTVVGQPVVPAPGLPGDTIATIDETIIAGQGNLVVFGASTFGTSLRGALFASRSGALELVTADGLTLPGTMVEIIDVLGSDTTSILPAPVGADKRGIAFTAAIEDANDPSASAGVYFARNGTITEVARDLQPAPNGELYDRFGAPLVKGSRVSFRTVVDSGNVCFVGAAGPQRTNLGCSGDTLADPPGTTLNEVLTDVPALASRGPVFRGGFFGPLTSGECLFTATTSGPTPVSCTGDLLPYGGTLNDFDAFPTMVIGASRKRVVSLANDADFFVNGLFEFSPRAVARIAADGLPTPIGGTYSMFDPRPTVSGKTVAFVSDVIGGASPNALFMAVLKH